MMSSEHRDTTAIDRQPRRRICEKGCDRPINVCLCDAIPKISIPTITKIVILHHPHERRHKLATVPVLKKCLEHCEIIVGRKLRYDDSMVLDSLRKEPFSGCLSTMEAVARCLRLLEPNGIEIESRLIGVLSTMVQFQASYLKPMNPRPKLRKKSKEDEWMK